MISEAEIRRLAGQWSTDPLVIDLDYVLGCFLSQWYQNEDAAKLRFKGGTCLRKCYFSDYRFSEDLDFTAEAHFTKNTIENLLESTAQNLWDIFGLDFSVRPLRVDVVNDEYGLESFQARLYYKGVVGWHGNVRAIRLDISRGEYLGFAPIERSIIHPYSDKDLLSDVGIPCYALEEMLAEKLRALGGQRRYAIARDLFDIYQLVTNGNVNIEGVKQVLPDKFKAKGVGLTEENFQKHLKRRDEFELDWDKSLIHLIPLSEKVTFDSAWRIANEILINNWLWNGHKSKT